MSILKGRGVILGKFMPPHQGHRYLVDFGRAFADELWVVVCSLPGETIPGTVRFKWMQELFPGVNVVHIEEVNPSANRQQPGAQKIWAEAVRKRIGKKIDYVFASEPYGWDFAHELEAQFIPVDPSRDQFPISGTELRERPFRNWHFLPPVVRNWFVKDVVIDPYPFNEDIVKRTAALLQTLYIPRYQMFYDSFATTTRPKSLKKTATTTPVKLELFNHASQAQREALRSQARCFLLRTFEADIDQPADIYLQVSTHETSHALKLASLSKDQNIPLLSLEGSAETLPHLFRDAILDNWRNLL